MRFNFWQSWTMDTVDVTDELVDAHQWGLVTDSLFHPGSDRSWAPVLAPLVWPPKSVWVSMFGLWDELQLRASLSSQGHQKPTPFFRSDLINRRGKCYVAQLIKTQRQILGFNLKVRKAKQSVTGSYLYLSLKWRSCLQESQNETVCESCLLPFYISL